MRIAVSAAGAALESAVDPRFGRCAWFVIASEDGGGCEAFRNPGLEAQQGAGIAAAQFVAERGAGWFGRRGLGFGGRREGMPRPDGGRPAG